MNIQWLAAACIVEILWMTLAFLLYRRTQLIGIIDSFWTFSFALQVLVACLTLPATADRKLTALLLACIWSLRLGIHITRRFIRSRKDDPRYEELRKVWTKNFDAGVFWMYQLQGLSVLILMGPFICYLADTGEQNIAVLSIAVCLFFVGLTGEALADQQLTQFKKINPGEVCNIGLWRYSRHPNYFFEWLIWVSFFTLSASSANGIWMIYAPLLMLILLTQVTGIPPAERQSIASKGEKFKHYQATTSAFFPWFPARDAERKS